jgi:hypothetical protein
MKPDEGEVLSPGSIGSPAALDSHDVESACILS